jgi:sulfite oxidase
MLSRRFLTACRTLRNNKQGTQAMRCMAAAVSSRDPTDTTATRDWIQPMMLLGATVLATTAAASVAWSEQPTTTTMNDANLQFELSAAAVGNETMADLHDEKQSAFYDALPTFTMDQVHERNGQDGAPVWMTYGGMVYDVTNFVVNHPGGSEKIMQAAGSAIEPYWHVYRQHYASDLPMKLMERMIVGILRESDQAVVDDAVELLDQPYAAEPTRHASLIVHSDTPMNAEVPAHLLTKNYLTPNSLFYIRHHHPVPLLSSKQIQEYALTIADATTGEQVSFTLQELRALPSANVIATLQCSGNRRSEFNTHQPTSGTPWQQGAISTARFTGVPLRTLLSAVASKQQLKRANSKQQQQHYPNKNDDLHVQFHALDGMSASIGLAKALDPDVIVAYAMNGVPLPRDHGFPLRVIVPGYAAVRNVKWLQRIQVSRHEASGPWQQGLNYKILPPGVTDARHVDVRDMPSIMEVSLFSGITHVERSSETTIKAYGWAWAGGGRNIVRVDVTADNGASWNTATLLQGAEQPWGRAWAWTFWECDIPVPAANKGTTVRLASKAVDMAFNVQPEECRHSWNVRGLANNAWYRAELNE